MSELLEKQEQLGKQHAAILEFRSKLDDDSYEWTAEDEQNWTAANKDYDACKRDVDRLQKLEDIKTLELTPEQRKQQAPEQPGVDPNQQPEQRAGDSDRVLRAYLRASAGCAVSAEDQAACKRFDFRLHDADQMKRGVSIQLLNWNPRPWENRGLPSRQEFEERQQATTPGTAGGFLIPQGFSFELERATLAFGGTRNVARTLRTASGNQIDWPTVDDTANEAVLIAENTLVGDQDITYGQIQIDAYKYTSQIVKVSQELIEDSAFDIASHVGSIIGERQARGTNRAFTTGTGVSQPQGIVTGSTNAFTAASTTLITSDEILDLVHSVDPSYRNLASTGFMMNDDTLLVVRKLKDQENRYLWEPNYQAGVPDRLVGWPIQMNQHMASPASTTIPMLFGAFEKFLIRDVAAVRLHRLEERYRELDQTAWVMFSRHDSRMLQPEAVKHFDMALV